MNVTIQASLPASPPEPSADSFVHCDFDLCFLSTPTTNQTHTNTFYIGFHIFNSSKSIQFSYWTHSVNKLRKSV